MVEGGWGSICLEGEGVVFSISPSPTPHVDAPLTSPLPWQPHARPVSFPRR